MPDPSRQEWRVLVTVVLICDVAAVLAGAGGATLIAGRWLHDAHLPHGAGLVAAMPVLALVGFLCGRLYAPSTLMQGTREFVGAIHGCVYAAVGTVLAGFLVSAPIPRLWTVLAWSLAAVGVCCVRLAVRRGAARLRSRGLFVQRALLVGADQHSIGIARQLSRPGSGIEVVGVLDDYKAPGTVLDGRFEVLGTPADLAGIAAAHGASDAIVVPDALAWETMRRVLADAAVTWSTGRVHLSAGFTDLLTTGVRISERNHVPLLTLKRVTLTPAEAAAKRALDCVLATLLLATLGPVLLATAARRRATGAGGGLRWETVIGRRGDPFELPTYDTGGTASGLLRKLPALACVLRGDLSIVGPRPIPVGEARDREVPTIRPGLTGHWRETDSPTEQATLDLYYIRSYSLWMDLHVLWVRARARLSPRRPRQGRTVAAEPVGSPHGAG